MSEEEENRIKIPLCEKQLSQGPSSSISGRLFKVQYVLQFSIKHNVVGASQKTMPEAQIPIMIMTPNTSCVQTQKQKIKEHPNWQPYVFDCLEFSMSEENEGKNEYAKYRKWLIQKEKEFVEQQKKKLETMMSNKITASMEEVNLNENTEEQKDQADGVQEQ